MLPANGSARVQKEVRTVRVVAVLEEHSIETGDVAAEVAQHVDLKSVLVPVFLERRRGIDADRKYGDSTERELVMVIAHLAELGRARAREGEREEGDEHG